MDKMLFSEKAISGMLATSAVLELNSVLNQVRLFNTSIRKFDNG